ncbi:MAG: inverse autotransporter beta domain-containing protein [Hyphomicrobiales bacterium]|nr:inverse autotransporter beta domain-containing protein [Hyphomicrobiales bacterium]
MKLLRFATIAASMALMAQFGSTQATTTTVSVPGNPVDAPALDLRAVGSQLVVETIEDALRQGGLALFDEGFQLDSSLNWVFGETIEGEVDVVLPLWNGGRHVIFAQPGVVFWTGFEEEERIDGNIGLVYRAEIANGVIGGGSVFYDYDFQYGHSRIGGGIDLQSGIFQGALNYYHPLSDVEDGREGFVEEALRGMDLRVALEREAMRVSANLGYWRFEGDEDVKGDWKPSYGFDAGIRIVPGVFLEGGWERHDETVSLDQRWNAGLAFRFSLPGFEGANYGDGRRVSNLWKPVEREKRILYEERVGIPRVNLNAMTARVGEPAAGGSETAVVMADLGKPLEEDVTLNIMVAETSTATLGTDFTYGHKVYELDEATGEQSAPAGDATPCPEVLAMACEVMIPAGVTRFDIEADIAMTTEREIPEFIDFQIEVPEEHADLLRGSVVERVIIEAHDNEVRFATNAATTLAEDNERTGVEVSVSIDRPSPTPITLNVATGGTATVNEDYRISTRSLVIPANASSASLTLWGINNDRGEGSKSIVLTISGSLPEGWEITEDEHTVTLQDDDLSIFFTDATTSRVDEPGTGSNADVMVSVGITQAPTADITVRVAAGGTGETATPGSSMDYTFTGMDFTFPADSTAPQTATFSVHPDNVAEGDEFIVLTLADDSTNSRDAEGSGFSLGIPHTITIPANDNTVGFASSSATTLAEDNTTTGVAVRVEVVEPAPADITLNVSTASTSTPAAVLGTHYNISTTSLRIPAGESSGTITLTGINNDSGDGSRNIVLTISSNNLPDGWAITDNEHTVTLQDDDLSISFDNAPDTLAEPAPGAGDGTHAITVRITQAPMADIKVTVEAGGSGDGTTADPGNDFGLNPVHLTFDASNLTRTFNINILEDSVPELDEFIVLTIKDMGTQMARNAEGFSLGANHTITIPANDNIVGFASAMSTLGEKDTANVGVSVGSNLPSPITLNIATGGSARETRDYTISSPSNKRLVIPAGESSGTITLAGVDDDASPSTAETIELTISVDGNLPAGWTLGSQTTHTVTLQDDDKSVGFVSGSGSAHETDSDNTHQIDVEISTAPTAGNVILGVTNVPEDTTATTGGTTPDVTYSPTSLTFVANDTSAGNLKQTITITVKPDDGKEMDEVLELFLRDDSTTLMDNDFSLGTSRYTFTIPTNDNTVSIDTSMSNSTMEEDGTANVVVSVDNPSPDPITLNVSRANSSTAVANTDYTVSGTLMIPANSSTGTLTITGIDDNLEQGQLKLDLTLSGTLPTGWSFTNSSGMSASELTYSVTIGDNELGVAGWVSATGTYSLATGNRYTLEAKLSKSPSAEIQLAISFSGSAKNKFFGITPNNVVTFPKDATGSDLTQSFTVETSGVVAGEEMIFTLVDSLTHLASEGSFSSVISPAVHTATVAP